MNRDLAQLNVELAIEVSRYLREHEEAARQVPHGAQLIIQIEGDEEFNEWSQKTAEKQRRKAQPVVYIIIQQLESVKSRIANAQVELALV